MSRFRLNFKCLKVHSQGAKAEPKAKIFLAVCHLFFSLFCMCRHINWGIRETDIRYVVRSFSLLLQLSLGVNMPLE